ncbi:hypothetical protein J1614_001283 [Plenodomus biglobosus]|nr:hypothetical protein J1614_001283 [Plenodomus biglobosus]
MFRTNFIVGRPLVLDPASQVIQTWGSLYKRCKPLEVCSFFTCNGGYKVWLETDTSITTTSSYCETLSSTCSYDILATDVDDTNPATSYWCFSNMYTGSTIYRIAPTAVIPPSTASASLITPSSASPPLEAPSRSSPPIGPIVGGALGGIALIGATVVAILFLRRRHRQHEQLASVSQQYSQQHPPLSPQPQPMSPTPYYNSAQGSYHPSDKTVTTNDMQVFPLAVQVGVGNGPMSPLPQFTSSATYATQDPTDLPELRS